MSASEQSHCLLILGRGVRWMAIGSRWLPKESVEYGLAYTSASTHTCIAPSSLSSGFCQMDSPNGPYHTSVMMRQRLKFVF
jgi:hypothetical protein